MPPDGAALRQIHILFGGGTSAGLSDAELVERFARGDGEAAEVAFAALLERHGPLVLRVCRGVLGDRDAADDAFQATFLVLATRHGAIRRRETLAGWLHGVSLRVALAARVAATRRRRLERRAATAESVEPEGDGDGAEVVAAMHEELARLPASYRDPILLCDLQGRTHAEAAARLGVPIGTVKSRQARGRERLRARLVRRGVAPAVALSMARLGLVSAAVPSPLIDVTSELILATAAGRMAASAALHTPATALARGVCKTMTMTSLKTGAVAAMALFAVATGAASYLAPASADDGPPQARAPLPLARSADEPPPAPPPARWSEDDLQAEIARTFLDTPQVSELRAMMKKAEEELGADRRPGPRSADPARVAARERFKNLEDEYQSLWRSLYPMLRARLGRRAAAGPAAEDRLRAVEEKLDRLLREVAAVRKEVEALKAARPGSDGR